MPQQLLRLGSASAAVSAGALVLLLAAPAADAAASERPCAKGTDPASTIENWKCNLGNLREALTPKTPTPSPSTKPTKQTKAAPKKSSPSKAAKAPAKTSAGSRAPSGTPSGGGAGGAPSTMTGGQGLKPYKGTSPSGLTGVLPTPEIATDPNGYLAAGTPQTRLISPVAASQRQDDQMAWVAAAAGAAGAVAALNLSVAGRSLRRRAGGR
ncbi:hypothetical protein [Actinomadura fibrosa]|uniref:Uncharacterized protein n=1 Tax=Actinomadura fibrosa TaxID=111802 RepID=A0ABW2Y1M6_9ACTN|nr:hypothetical protein [Actinomadura fibrosa]